VANHSRLTPDSNDEACNLHVCEITRLRVSLTLGRSFTPDQVATAIYHASRFGDADFIDAWGQGYRAGWDQGYADGSST
jgi:hypothetical protein